MRLALGAAFLLVQAAAQTQNPAPPPAVAGPTTYVGSETCQTCHEEIFGKFAKNPHHTLETSTKWKGQSCESCHGPGSKHAESVDRKDIRNPLKLAPAESERICLTCHLNQKTQAGRIQNGHGKNQVACVSCHALHETSMHKTPEELVARKPAAVNEKCASCHVSVWASFQRPYKHKLPEGAMSCIDCHNPHGRSISVTARATAGNEPQCIQCHGDKRGPFVFEHAPVRTDGCSACHEPHGSSHPRMLTRNDARVTCLECHANVGTAARTIGGVPPAFHDLRNPRFQACVTCHVKVHGSNVDRAFLR